MFQPSLRSEKVTNLHITVIILLLACLGYTLLQTPITTTSVLNFCQLYDNYQYNNEMEGKSPMEIKGLVVKWQRALVTPFRNATALEADPFPLEATAFTGKRRNYITFEHYIRRKKKTI